MSRDRTIRVLERVAVVVASLALSIGLIILLSGYFAGRDQAGVSSAGAGPGLSFRDQGNTHLYPGELHPPYDSNPPTSGAHVSEPVLRDRAALTDDQLLQALSLGNVVVMYGSPAPPPGLQTLAREVAGPFTPALAASGQAVILAQAAGNGGTDRAGVGTHAPGQHSRGTPAATVPSVLARPRRTASLIRGAASAMRLARFAFPDRDRHPGQHAQPAFVVAHLDFPHPCGAPTVLADRNRVDASVGDRPQETRLVGEPHRDLPVLDYADHGAPRSQRLGDRA